MAAQHPGQDRSNWEEKDNCSICNAGFGIINRRHHCRQCARSICAYHSTTNNQPRICTDCVRNNNNNNDNIDQNNQAPAQREEEKEDVVLFEFAISYKIKSSKQSNKDNLMITQSALLFEKDPKLRFEWNVFVDIDDSKYQSNLLTLTLSNFDEKYIDISCDNKQELIDCLNAKLVKQVYDVSLQRKNMDRMQQCQLTLRETSFTFGFDTIKIKQCKSIQSVQNDGFDEKKNDNGMFQVNYDADGYVRITCDDQSLKTDLTELIEKAQNTFNVATAITYTIDDSDEQFQGNIVLTDSSVVISDNTNEHPRLSFGLDDFDDYEFDEAHRSVELQFTNNDQITRVVCITSIKKPISFICDLSQKTSQLPTFHQNGPTFACVIGNCEKKYPQYNLYECRHSECEEKSETTSQMQIVCEMHLRDAHRDANHGFTMDQPHVFCWNSDPKLARKIKHWTREIVLRGGPLCIPLTHQSAHVVQMHHARGIIRGAISKAIPLMHFGHVPNMIIEGIGIAYIAVLAESVMLGCAMYSGKVSHNTLKRKFMSCWSGGLVSTGAYVGWTLGEFGGITGMVSGALIGIIGSIFLGLATRVGVDFGWKKYMKNKDPQMELREEALYVFFENKNVDIKNKRKFNLQKVSRRYELLCDNHNPMNSTKGIEDIAVWLTLGVHYGVLLETLQQLLDQA